MFRGGEDIPDPRYARPLPVPLSRHDPAGARELRSGRPAAAAAVAIQDNLRYDEPPPFYFPARHSLGAVLLHFGWPAEAERVYRTDLAEFDGPETIPNRNRLNGWSLLGLAQALEAQGRPSGAVREAFRQAWRHADVEITGSRF